MEATDECWCGNTLINDNNLGSRLAAASSCNAACTGNANQKCGGAWAMSVYGAVGCKRIERE